MNYYLKVLRQWKDFDGRSDRREYWMFVLVNFAISMALLTIDQLISPGNEVLSGIYSLFIFIPGIAVTIRRLHDIGKSGWMQLVILIPLIGWIWFLVLMVNEGEAGRNQYGESLRQTRF
ncbi:MULTISPECIES: DUF805 domain-containing protein [Psychrilyobacter]|uniref:DUF805 domain-containing protein n=1 Tax=Psychrilyobacter piezotolerans TaxID=2293438 RepID=A0ABX9KLD0_9FUSO|nr:MULTISPECIES: DUF805 domain-containing protein [Psychrilyobacter]MCS5423024.1 DUF805 domain-containing protein [Psychrilyobacter sp. S5]NDI76515.1 DUF805 domain-containing protein [Psychrilyobacter piezotolerans]RDE66106.1 DUF805 domain-containing protein [Psychrilyobacter sp. S5]REI43284.1 DUF805 domain-containing protein [Psychrilyobacter piezotolerans]